MKLNQLHKKLLIILGILVAAVVVFILVAQALAGGTLSFERIESKLITAAKEYYKENEDLLPLNEGEVREISAATLAKQGYIKSIEELADTKNACQGKVIVEKIKDEYSYFSTIDCGSDYKTELFADYLKERIVPEDQEGLQSLNGELVYRGAEVNNYLKYGDLLFRIIKVDKDGDIKLIGLKKVGDTINWDTKYNINEDSNYGINDFTKSNIAAHLHELEDSQSVLKDKEKQKLKSKKVCVGKVNYKENKSKVIIDECAKLGGYHFYQLPVVSDITNASLDKNCISPSDRSCQNYNYMSAYRTNVVTSNASNQDTYSVTYGYNGIISSKKASGTFRIYPVIYLNKNVIFDEGKGTEDDPYKIR